MLLYSKKLLDEKIFKTSFPLEKIIFIFLSPDAPSLQKGLGPQKWLFAIYSESTVFFLKKLKYSMSNVR